MARTDANDFGKEKCQRETKNEKKTLNIVIKWGRKGQNRRWDGRPNLDNVQYIYILWYNDAESRLCIAARWESGISNTHSLTINSMHWSGQWPRQCTIFVLLDRRNSRIAYDGKWQCGLGVRIARSSLDCEHIFGLHQWFFQILDFVLVMAIRVLRASPIQVSSSFTLSISLSRLVDGIFENRK